MLEKNRVFVGYSTDTKIRYSATSGGIGSSILKYLFETHQITSALSLCFNKDKLKYEPQIIYRYEDYQMSGSVYHEINIMSFIKQNINNLGDSFICFALPCQSKTIRSLLLKHKIDSYIIELCCSSQQNYEATEYLLKREGIQKENVDLIKYRGDGWPSGISITMKDGTKKIIPNINSIWTKIFHSKLFIMNRCFTCSPHLISLSDITLADPWRIDMPDKEKNGRTLCRVYTKKMNNLLNDMYIKGYINIEDINESYFNYSQEGTINRKSNYIQHKKYINTFKGIITNKLYLKYVTNNVVGFNFHLKLKSLIEKITAKL